MHNIISSQLKYNQPKRTTARENAHMLLCSLDRFVHTTGFLIVVHKDSYSRRATMRWKAITNADVSDACVEFNEIVRSWITHVALIHCRAE